MVELRWAVPAETTTKAPRLQYRQLPAVIQFGSGSGWTGWQDVPLVVVPEASQPAPVLSTLGVGGNGYQTLPHEPPMPRKDEKK